MAIPTFTKLPEASKVGSDLKTMVKKHGAATSPLSPEWRKYVDNIKSDLDKAMAIFEKEEKEYATFLVDQVKKCKDSTAEAIKISGKMKNGFQISEYNRLLAIQKLVRDTLDDIKTAKGNAVNHQPFRLDLASITEGDGAPDELLDYRKTFSARRKRTIDTSEALMRKVAKVTVEYVSRIETSKTWCEKLQKDHGKKTVLVYSQFKELEKVLEQWQDKKSKKWEAFNNKKRIMEGTVNEYAKPRKSGYTKKDFDDTEDYVQKRLKPICEVVKSALNTDHKKFEMAAALAGNDLNRKEVYDQKLVKKLTEGFKKVKGDVQTLERSIEKDLMDALKGYKKKYKIK